MTVIGDYSAEYQALRMDYLRECFSRWHRHKKMRRLQQKMFRAHGRRMQQEMSRLGMDIPRQDNRAA